MNIEPTSATTLFRPLPGPILGAPRDRCVPEGDSVEIGSSPRRVRSVSCVWSEGTVLSRAGTMLVVKWDNGGVSYVQEGDFMWL
jgi:hypothetical protein